MAITSENNRVGFRRYGNTQFRYAMIYVLITFLVLLFLNIYSGELSHQAFQQSKKAAMTEKCQLAADEILADNNIWLITKESGEKLAESDGPFMLVVNNDEFSTRWAKSVVRIKIK